MSTKEDPKNTKAPNDIRIGMNSRVRNVIRYSQSIMEEKKLRELKFSAVGGSIGRLLDTVEVLKVLIPNLYQQNKITSVAYQTSFYLQMNFKQKMKELKINYQKNKENKLKKL